MNCSCVPVWEAVLDLELKHIYPFPTLITYQGCCLPPWLSLSEPRALKPWLRGESCALSISCASSVFDGSKSRRSRGKTSRTERTRPGSVEGGGLRGSRFLSLASWTHLREAGRGEGRGSQVQERLEKMTKQTKCADWLVVVTVGF